MQIAGPTKKAGDDLITSVPFCWVGDDLITSAPLLQSFPIKGQIAGAARNPAQTARTKTVPKRNCTLRKEVVAYDLKERAFVDSRSPAAWFS